MWRTLQQDFSEFVAVVAADSKTVLAAVMQQDEGDEDDNGSSSSSSSSSQATPFATGGLSATDPDLLALQRDPSTYTEAVEEADKRRWVSFVAGLDLSSKATDMASLLKDNEDVARLHAKLVRAEGEENEEGAEIDAETFWSRYFFRLEGLTRQKRGVTLPLALAGDDDDEEDLSWGDDEDEEEEETKEVASKEKCKAEQTAAAPVAAAPPAISSVAVPDVSVTPKATTFLPSTALLLP